MLGWDPNLAAESWAPDTGITASDRQFGPFLSSHNKPSSAGVFGHARPANPGMWMILYVASGWSGLSYTTPMNTALNTHDNKPAFSFYDGHVDTISWAQMQDAARYGPTGESPLWLRLYW